MALRLARAKAEAGNAGTHDLVLAADTVVVVDGHSLGKPADEQDCLAMLGALSGRSHKVLTGVALRGPDETSTALSETDVYFREISRDEARAYWQSGEPSDKAGAYAIQGLGGVFVTGPAPPCLRQMCIFAKSVATRRAHTGKVGSPVTKREHMPSRDLAACLSAVIRASSGYRFLRRSLCSERQDLT
jgi:hypothetical protein